MSLEKRSVIGLALAQLSRAMVLSPLLLMTSGCTLITDQVISAGNYLGRQIGIVDEEKSFSGDDQREQALATITPEQEYYIGRAVAARILQRFPQQGNPELQKYVQLVGHSLIVNDGGGSPFGGYHFKVIESDHVNAISAPGGYVFITTGFLRLIGNEDQLAAILAHEIAHISGRHGLRTLKDGDLLSELSGLGLASGGLSCIEALTQATVLFSRLVDGVVDTLLEAGYSQEFEYQADSGAFARLVQSGYEPQAIYGALEAIELSLKNSDNPSGGWFSTHPSVSERVAKLKSDQPVNALAGIGGAGLDLRTSRAQSFLKGL